MTTRVISVSPERPDPAALDAAAEALRAGRLVVLPTETVYGWACRGDDPDAVASLRAAKGRDADKPFTLHVAPRDEPASATVARAAGPLGPPARRLADRTLPGPLTLVVRDRRGEWLGVRVPDDRVAAGVLSRCPFPVLATSVNRSGEPPATTGADAAATAGGRSAVVLDAGPSRFALGSTVVRCGPGFPEVLREGATPGDQIPVLCARWLVFASGDGRVRAPLAEALARGRLADLLDVAPGCSLAEAGVHTIAAAVDGRLGTHPSAQALDSLLAQAPSLAREGFRGVAATPRGRCEVLTPSLVESAERTWVMTPGQRATILATMPQVAERVALLDPRGGAIDDDGGLLRRLAAAVSERMEEFMRIPDA